MSLLRKLFIVPASILWLSAVWSVGANAHSMTHVTHNLNLRAGPATSYPVVKIIPVGAEIDISACGQTWCSIIWAGHHGYVNGLYLVSHVTVAVSPLAHVHHVY